MEVKRDISLRRRKGGRGDGEKQGDEDTSEERNHSTASLLHVALFASLLTSDHTHSRTP